jgi:hypothetical protein
VRAAITSQEQRHQYLEALLLAAPGIEVDEGAE